MGSRRPRGRARGWAATILSAYLASHFVACIEPTAPGLPAAPDGAKSVVLVSFGPPKAGGADGYEVAAVDLEGEKVLIASSGGPILALYYRCSAADVGFDGNRANPLLPLPETTAVHRLEGGRGDWLALASADRSAALEGLLAARAEPRCNELTVDRNQGHLSNSVRHGTWLDPSSRTLLIADEAGRLFVADPLASEGEGLRALGWPELEFGSAQYDANTGRVWGFVRDRATDRIQSFSLTSDEQLTVDTATLAADIAALAASKSNDLVFSAPGETFAWYGVAVHGAVGAFDGQRWEVIAPGQAFVMNRGLTWMGPDELLVVGQCSAPLGPATVGSNGRCLGELGHFERVSPGGRFERSYEGLPVPAPTFAVARFGVRGPALVVAQDVSTFSDDSLIFARDASGTWGLPLALREPRSVERTQPLADGALLALDGGVVLFVDTKGVRGCSRIETGLDQRGLVTHGESIAVIGESATGALGVTWAHYDPPPACGFLDQ